MSETPAGEHLEEEPQEERGAPGSRDEGHGPGGGPTDRPTGGSGAGDSTKVADDEPIEEDMPQHIAGDQGG